MAPARQRLEAGDGAVLEPHDRLEQHVDLAALERVAQIVGRASAGPSACDRMPRGEQLDPVAARLLGVGERDLGVGEQIDALRVQRRVEERDADRHRQRDLAVAEADRRRRAPLAATSTEAVELGLDAVEQRR